MDRVVLYLDSDGSWRWKRMFNGEIRTQSNASWERQVDAYNDLMASNTGKYMLEVDMGAVKYTESLGGVLAEPVIPMDEGCM